MKCSKCKFDNPEDAKFCIECGDSMEYHCPECGAETPATGKYCKYCGHNLREFKGSTSIDYSKPQSYTPKFLADKILTTHSAMVGERKLVTVLFADVANYTAMAEKLDPEEVHQIMDGCFKILMDEVHKYEGTINQFTGDGVMALFGAPVALEDHAQGACYASLAIQNAINAYNEHIKQDYRVDFKMRIGLNSGIVIVGAIGDDLRMDYTAVGDTTNLASRMESLADPGAIMVSKKTYRITKDFFEFEPMEQVEVKGKNEPQNIYRLNKAGEIKTRIKASFVKGLTKFVGRKITMAALVEAFERACSGSGQVVGMVGEAGVGKSRLLFEFLRSLERNDITYLEGRCIHHGETLPYLPFVEVLKKICQIEETDGEAAYRQKLKDSILGLDPAFEASLPFLEDLLSLKVEDKAFARMEPDQRRWKTIDAVKNILIKQSQQKPLILAIEDLHWIDKSSEELLSRLIESITNAKILLLCLYRPDYRHAWSELSYYQKLGLNRLTSESITELVETILGEGQVDEDLRSLILGKAGGNPLFVEEFTRSLLDTGSIGRSDGNYVLTKDVSEIKIPDTLQAVIAARIDRQDESLKQVLQVASVIGKEFTFRVLREILKSEDELRQHLQRLQSLEFIYEKSLFPELKYHFKHALTQEVAYNNLLLKKQKEFHRRIAETIEKLYAETLPEHLGPLAFHFYQANVWSKAFKYLIAAGERARHAYATRESIDYFDKAVEVSQNIPNAVSKEQLMHLYDNRGKTWRALTEYEKAEGDFQKVIELAQKLENKRQEVNALLNLAQCYGVGGGLGKIENMQDCLDRALKLIRETGDEAGEIRYQIMAGMFVGGDVGKTTRARGHLEKALGMCRKSENKRGLGPALGFLALSHNWSGDFELCIKEVQESADIARELGNQYLLVSTFHWAVLGYGGNGEYDKAFNALDELSKGAAEIGSRHLIAIVPNDCGWIYRELCNFDKAIVHDKNGVDVSRRYGDPECEIFSLLNLVGDHIGLGDYKKARHYLDEVQRKRELIFYRQREWRYSMHVSRYKSELSLLQGDYYRAMEFAEDMLSRGQNSASKKYISFGWKLKGEVLLTLGRMMEAVVCFEKARDLADQMAYPPLMWKTRYLLSQVYGRQKKHEAVRRVIKESIAVIEKMASKVSEIKVKETFLGSESVQGLYKEIESN